MPAVAHLIGPLQTVLTRSASRPALPSPQQPRHPIQSLFTQSDGAAATKMSRLNCNGRPLGRSRTSTRRLTTGVDSPYQLMPNGPVADSPASYVGGECVKNFNYIPEGWESDVPYIILSRFGAQLSHVYINETFGTFIPDYVGNNWTPPTPGQYLSIDGTFFDDMCSVTAGYSLTPTTQIPQTPLGNVAIDHANQNWYVGSPTLGSGVQVQTNAFQRFRITGVTPT